MLVTFLRAPDGYALGKRLGGSAKSTVHEAVRSSDGAVVVLKVYAGDKALDAHSRTQLELEMLRRIEAPGVPRALDLDRTVDPPVLVIERLPGTPLSQIVPAGGLPLDVWLEVAIQLADTLSRVHAAGILHKDVSPANILFDAATRRVSIIDFGMAGEVGAAHQVRGLVVGKLHYIAPEQTGRMNRGCEFRSDLYSLGASLYHACVGNPPFSMSDPLALIHAHIARIPAAPASLRPEVPAVISSILLRLLRKEPSERYPSARALHADLVRCRDHLTRGGQLDPGFELGSSASTDRPCFTAQLRGRDRELEILQQAYACTGQGGIQTIFLVGKAGIGKSSLVDALRPAILQSGGYLAVGKFDPSRERAYSGWSAALASLVEQLLLESDERLERWGSELRAGLGGIARVAVELVPDLEFIVGDTPLVPALAAREARARLSLALRRLLATSATPEHPLVLFLDDLHWSDDASLDLLEELLASELPAALLVICAHRSLEGEGADPVAAFRARIERDRPAPPSIELGPLSDEAAASLLATALGQAHERVRDLATLIERKTGNVPLLVRQFVEFIHERGWLRHEAGSGWVWDAAQVESADVPEGAVALIAAKIDRLEPEARTVLEHASCVGDEFEVELLGQLCTQTRGVLYRVLIALTEAGLFIPTSKGFRFAHDRIRETAQSLLPEAERTRRHHQIAQLILARTTEAERAQRIFEIVGHLQSGLQHVPEAERLTVARLGLLAGQRALAGGARAETYLAMARDAFRESDWSEQRALGFDLHLESAESAFQVQEPERALELLDALERRAPNFVELARVAVKRIQVLALHQNPRECVDYAVAVVRRMGLRWPRHPSTLRTRFTLRALEWRLRGRLIDDVLFQARGVDPRKLMPLLVLRQAGAVMVREDVNLPVIAVCYALRFYLRHGYATAPAFALATYAAHAYILLGDAEHACRWAESALRWIERVPDPIWAPRAELLVRAVLHPWLMERREALARMSRIAEQALEVGDLEFSLYARFLAGTYLALAGDPVRASERRLHELAESVRRSHLWYPEPQAAYDVYRVLLDGALSPRELEQHVARSDARIAQERDSAEPYVRTLWQLVLCVQGRHDLAFAQSEAIGARLFHVVPYVHVADHTFYRGLSAAALASESTGHVRRRYRRVLRSAQHRLRRWARAGPDFAHMAMFLAAENARLSGDFRAATALYEQAARRARQQQFAHHAALAHERRARTLIAVRREAEAASALRDAIALYEEWGAEAKAAALGRERSKLGAMA